VVNTPGISPFSLRFILHLYPEQYSILIRSFLSRRILSPSLSVVYTRRSHFHPSFETWWEGGIMLLLLHNRYKTSSRVFPNGMQFTYVITSPVP